MEFKYTSSITIDEYDMNKICNDVKKGRDLYDALDDALSGYDDCDYYHIGDIYRSVKEEVEHRIKESEQEETNMATVTQEMTNDELITLRNEINKILEDREKEKVNEAIENFRKAFEEVKKVVFQIRVGEEWEDNCYHIEDFEDFYFDM